MDELKTSQTIARILIPLAVVLVLTPWISSGAALVLGAAIAIAFGNPYATQIKKFTPQLLSYSVMGLGAGMNLHVVAQVGMQGIGYTILGIATAFLIGNALGKILNVERNTSLLITMGTAICGGSAIAAIAPTIRARSQEVTVALGTVFLLNAAALILFPGLGHYANLSETQFGLWSALAIHDTSSVVGATLQYGAHAVEVGTTVKLARALWIVPLTLLIGWQRSREERRETSESKPFITNTEPIVNPMSPPAEKPKAKRPWFILGFLIAAAIVTWIPDLQPVGHEIEALAKKLLVLTLFLIGSSLTRSTLQSVGLKPFIQGVVLWICMASLSFAAIYWNLIH